MEAPNHWASGFKVQVWAGMNPMNDDEPPRLGIRLTHDGCRGFSMSYAALPSANVEVTYLLETIREHMLTCHPESEITQRS